MAHWLRTGLVLALISLVFASVEGSAQTRRALLIGMKDYAPEVGPLVNPHKDVTVMKVALEEAGFEVDVLVDDVANGKNVTRSKILSKVREHAEALEGKEDAVSFVYYSGHGAANEEDGKNYLIPQAVSSVSDVELWDESVQLETMIERLQNIAPDAAHFVVFDACRNELKLAAQSRALTKGFVAEQERGGVFIAFSTSPTMRATDGDPDAESGPYARILANEIRKGGKRHDVLFTDVKISVADETGQQPWERSGLARVVFLNGNVINRPPIEDSASERTSEPTSNGGGSGSSDAIDQILSLRKALIVSNSDYQTPFMPLKTAHAEADELASTMSAAGFEVVQLQDPSRADLVSQTMQLLQSFNVDAFEKLAVFHYIGHVKALSDSANRGLSEGGTNYLIPANAPIRSSFDLPLHGVELGRLTQLASQIEGLSTVFIVDGCREDELVSIDSTENCVDEAERDNVLITINSIPAVVEDSTSATAVSASEESYTEQLRDELIVGGDIIDVVQRTNARRVATKGEYSTKTSGDFSQSFELAPVSQYKLEQAKTQDAVARTCYNAVQSKIAWDADGKSTGWADANVNRLCAGAETSAAPAQCFKWTMDLGRGSDRKVTWSQAIDLCSGVTDGQAPYRCFAALPDLGVWDAISACSVNYEANAEKACYNAVQDKLAWDGEGKSKRWNDTNVNNLCKGRETSIQPAKCFEAYMASGKSAGVDVTWGVGIELCQGATEGTERAACYVKSRDSGQAHAAALKACTTTIATRSSRGYKR